MALKLGFLALFRTWTPYDSVTIMFRYAQNGFRQWFSTKRITSLQQLQKGHAIKFGLNVIFDAYGVCTIMLTLLALYVFRIKRMDLCF